MFKKIISCVLSVILILSLVSVITVSAVGYEKGMLYVKTSSPEPLIQLVQADVGKTYYFSFGLSDSIKNFSVICLNDDSRFEIEINAKLIDEKNKGYSTIYTYSMTLPEKSINGETVADKVFIGLLFNGNTEGYVFDCSLYEADDAQKNELFSNPDFSLLLDEWSWGWDVWFANWEPSGLSEWSNNQTTLRIDEYNKYLLFEDEKQPMLHIRYESVKMTDDVFVQKVKSIEADTEYTISFSYSMVSGLFDDAVYFILLGDDGNSSTIKKPIIRFYTSNDYILSSSIDEFTITYTFKLDSNTVNSYTEFYAGFYFDTSPRMITEFYAADLKLYKSSKPKENLLTKNDFNDMSGWCSYWQKAAVGSQDFGSSVSSKIEYLACYEPYNSDLFTPEQDNVHYGDTNFDGVIDVRDIVILKKHTAGNKGYISSFDCNCDNNISASDLTVLRRHLIGNELIVWDESRSFIVETLDLNGGAEKESASLKEQISYNPDTLLQKSNSTVYYVSNSGTYADYKSQGKMLNIKSTGAKEFIKRVSVKAGNTYYFTFGLSDSISNFNAVCYTDGARSKYDANITLVSKNDLGASTVYVYSYTIDNSFDGKLLYFGFKAVGNAEGYFFSPSVYDAADENKTDLLGNNTFSDGLDGWSWGWDAWFGTTTSFGTETGLTEWSNSVTTLKLVDYNEKTLGFGADNKSKFVTTDEFKSLKFVNGDTVLFRRGDIFRLGISYNLTTGVSYGAYGNGEKPVISGSLKDYANNTLWTTEDGFLWKTTVNANFAANIVFNGGEFTGVPKITLSEVDDDGDFYFDSENKILYLYFRQINPGYYFDSIEISSVETLFITGGGRHDIKVENITFEFVAKHAINMVSCYNIDITGCEFYWIGGAFADTVGGRYGNGIQFWNKAVNCNVNNNYLYQIYDAALTFQGNSVGVYTDITYTNNLVEYSSMNFEFWASQKEGETATISNILFEDNILRFAGYGFSGIQRNNKGNQAFILAWYHDYEPSEISNFNITGNIFDVANCRIFYAVYAVDLINISGNTYYQDANSDYFVNVNENIYANCLENFEAAIKNVDSEAVVYWQSEF